MSYNRRKFIKTSGSITSGLMLANMSGLSLLDACNKPGKIGDFGIQLYTLRDDMPKDPSAVLKQVASFGYKQIESYEGAISILKNIWMI